MASSANTNTASPNARTNGRHSSEASPESHPFKNSTSLLEVIPQGIDIEEESRLYDELCNSPLPDTAFDFEYSDNFPNDDHPRTRNRPPSVFSAEDAPSIWLADNSNSGSSTGFARDVHIAGWTHVGDKLGGAYIVYDCAITTKEGTVMHTHKRYSAFAQLYAHLRATLPAAQQRFVPPLPPKNPLSKFRATFLDRRRRALQHWLASVLLHPDVGGCEAVRQWVME